MSTPVKQITTPEIAGRAIASVRLWQSGQLGDLPCPVCLAPGVVITDKSARPHMAWYVFNCRTCGLDEAMAVPAGAHTTDRDS